MCVMGSTEEEERGDRDERIFEEIMAENLFHWWKTLLGTLKNLTKVQVEQAQRDPHLDTL